LLQRLLYLLRLLRLLRLLLRLPLLLRLLRRLLRLPLLLRRLLLWLLLRLRGLRGSVQRAAAGVSSILWVSWHEWSSAVATSLSFSFSVFVSRREALWADV